MRVGREMKLETHRPEIPVIVVQRHGRPKVHPNRVPFVVLEHPSLLLLQPHKYRDRDKDTRMMYGRHGELVSTNGPSGKVCRDRQRPKIIEKKGGSRKDRIVTVSSESH